MDGVQVAMQQEQRDEAKSSLAPGWLKSYRPGL